MEGSSKILYIIGAIGIALLVVGAAFALFYTLSDSAEDMTNSAVEISNDILESKFTQYDGDEAKGSSLINLIKDVNGDTDNVYIMVKTKANTTGVYYVCDQNNARLTADAQRTLLKNARTKTHVDYITPSAEFYGEVIRNTNGAIVGMIFTQQ